MLLDIINRALNNGLNLRKAFKDELIHRKNIKNFSSNLAEYRSLLNEFIGYDAYEYELFGEYSYSMRFYHKDYLICVYFMDEPLIGDKDNYTKYNIDITPLNNQDFINILSNSIPQALQDLKLYKIKIIKNDYKSIHNIFNELIAKDLIGNYKDIKIAKNELVEKLTNLNIIKS